MIMKSKKNIGGRGKGKSADFFRWWKGDSFGSLIFTLAVAFIVIQFIFFPLLSLITGTALPLVIVESCSMYHSTNIYDVLENPIYGDYNLDINDAKSWAFGWGLNKGDIIFVISPDNIVVGDVIIFNGGAANPIIHRVIKIDAHGKITTKGDHNNGLLPTEINIESEQLIGKAVVGVPFVGWVKLIWFDFFRNSMERGFCS